MQTPTWIALGIGLVAVAGLWAGAGALHAQQAPAAEEQASPQDRAQQAPAAEKDEAAPVAGQDAGLVAQGEYLVRGVAMCHECHTRRDEEGDLILDRLLMGAPMPVNPPGFVERWGRRAPAIAGLPGYTDEAAVRLLTRGITSRGTIPRPPMPQYRFSEEDARAVIAYLRSLR